MPLPDHIRAEPNPPLTMERAQLARTMYVEKFTVARILAQCLMSLGTLYNCLDGVPFGASGPRLPPIPRRRVVLAKRRAPLPADRVSLASRLWRTAERAARDIETRLASPSLPPAERERDVRMLGAVVKTLRDLAAVDAGGLLAPAAAPAGGEGGQTGAGQGGQGEADIEAMRAELMRRIENLCKAADEPASEPEK